MTRPKALQITSQLPWWFSSSLINGALWPSGIVFEGVAMLLGELIASRAMAATMSKVLSKGTHTKTLASEYPPCQSLEMPTQTVRVPRSR